MLQRLLQIDDDPDDCELFSTALAEVCNIKYDCIHCPVKALKQLADQIILPDIILLDLNMPLMDGMAFLKKIKTIEKLASIPVIICSTSSRKDFKAKAMALGAADYITKPGSYSALKEIVKSILTRSLHYD